MYGMGASHGTNPTLISRGGYETSVESGTPIINGFPPYMIINQLRGGNPSAYCRQPRFLPNLLMLFAQPPLPFNWYKSMSHLGFQEFGLIYSQ